MARTWCTARVEFFWPNNSEFGPKIRFFCYRTLDVVDGLFVALGKAVDMASALLCNFLYPRNGCFPPIAGCDKYQLWSTTNVNILNPNYKLQVEAKFLIKTDVFIHHEGQFFSPDSRFN